MFHLIVSKTFRSVGFDFLKPFVSLITGEHFVNLAVLASLHASRMSTRAPQDTQFKVVGINQFLIASIMTRIKHPTKLPRVLPKKMNTGQTIVAYSKRLTSNYSFRKMLLIQL